jgi:hypothetical protein
MHISECVQRLGPDLEAVLARQQGGQGLPLPLVVSTGQQMLTALHTLHETHKTVHRYTQ